MTTTISAARMRGLLAAGHARPLLNGHFPVPVELDHQWWHVPDDPGLDPETHPSSNSSEARPDSEVEFVRASPVLAARFDQLAARQRAAEEAMARADRGGRR